MYSKHQKVITKIETGQKLTDKQSEDFSKDIPKHYWSNEKSVVFINKTIYTDDNIHIIVKRLCVYLKQHFKDATIEDVYMWIEQSVPKSQHIIANFVDNCFQNNKLITFNEFKEAAENYFTTTTIANNEYNLVDKTLAFNILMDSDIKHVVVPLQFIYSYNEYFKYIPYNPLKADDDEQVAGYNINTHNALTLHYFGQFDCINIALYKNFSNLQYLFPFHDKKSNLAEIIEYIEDLDMIEESLDIETNNINHESHISYFHFKTNEINFNQQTDLGKAFDRISTSALIPFIKYQTYTNVYYKVDKDFIKDQEMYDEYWTKWTELTGLGKRIPENTSITFKLDFANHGFCSFRLLDTFVYDVKFSMGTFKKAPLSKILEFCKTNINTLLKQLRSVYPQAYIPEIDDNNISIERVNSIDKISQEKKTIKLAKFEDIISKILFPYFNIIPSRDRNALNLQYKKVDNYLKYDNITDFIIKNSKLPEADLVKEMARYFRITEKDAKDEFEKRQEDIRVELQKKGNARVFRLQNDGYVEVHIKMRSSVDMEFDIVGFKYLEMQHRIVQLLKVLVTLTDKSIKIKNLDAVKIEKGLFGVKDKGMNLKDVGKDEIVDNEIDLDFLDVVDKMEYAEHIGEVPVDNEIDDDFLEIAKKVEDAPDVEPAAYEEAEADPKKRITYFKKRLLDADPKLFNYKVPDAVKGEKKNRKDYSTLCSGRFPVVINKEQKDHIDKTFPGSYNGHLRTGSDKEKANKNYYICPAIWCPKSMVSLTQEQYDRDKCPFEGEQALFLNGDYWKGNPNRFVSVLDPHVHPNELCIPCCFKGKAVNHTAVKGKHKKNIDECKLRKPELLFLDDTKEEVEIISEVHEDELLVGNPKYIKGEFNWPLQAGHFGLLPKELYELMGSKRCGERPDGTGNMILDSECYLRQGSMNKQLSFLSCVANILSNPNISSVNDIYKVLKDEFTLERFVSLENGKILKIFINERFSIFDAKSFQEFTAWFVKQLRYITRFNLGKVYRTLLNEHTAFSKSIRHYKDVIREFMIYNAYKHYLEYIKTATDHRAMIDLFNCERQLLNPKSINIVVIQLLNGKLSIQCPFNRTSVYDKKYPFAFILFNGKYYETITKVRYNKDGLSASHTFTYRKASVEIQKLIDFIYSNCIDTAIVPEKIITEIELTTKLTTRYLVLDYGFKAKGVLLSQNVYVPFKNKISIFNLLRKKFIYYSDLINYKCKIDIKKIYTALAKKDNFYTVDKVNDKYLTLSNKTVVPINLNKEDIQYDVFEEDLEIFIGHEKDDRRKSILSIVNENKKVFSVFLNSVITYINSHQDVRKEIDFITDFKNPFPLNFKRSKLINIMESVVANVLIVPDDAESKEIIERSNDVVLPCPDPLWDKCLVGLPKDKIDEFKIKISEQLLINNSFYFNTRTKHFRHVPTEFLFEHHEIIVGRHKELVKRLKDPIQMLNEKLDEEFGDYIFNVANSSKDFVLELIGDDPRLEDNYYNYKVDGKSTYVVDVKEYNNMYMYVLFEALYKTLHPNDNVDSLYLKSICRNYLINDYETANILPVIENKSFEKQWKELKKQKVVDIKPSISVCDQLFNSTKYFPSLYELKILSEFVGVNVVLFKRNMKGDAGKKLERQPNILYIDNRSANSIFIHHKFDNKNVRDVYQIIIVDMERKKYMFNATEMKKVLFNLQQRNMLYEVDVALSESALEAAVTIDDNA